MSKSTNVATMWPVCLPSTPISGGSGLGDAYGCHSCGTTVPGAKGNWVGGHMPASYFADGAPQVLYPQCRSCSNAQGLHIMNECVRKGRR